MVFWKWWTTTVLTYLGLAVACFFGAYEFVLENDFTYLTFAIVVLFTVTNTFVGHAAWRVKNGESFQPEQYGPAWFTSDALLSLGMVGTLIGFLTVLTTAFGSIDTADQESMKQVIAQLATGMGTALLTTLAGLITSIILKGQLVSLEEENAKVSFQSSVR